MTAGDSDLSRGDKSVFAGVRPVTNRIIEKKEI